MSSGQRPELEASNILAGNDGVGCVSLACFAAFGFDQLEKDRKWQRHTRAVVTGFGLLHYQSKKKSRAPTQALIMPANIFFG